jgi:hypothetical protein
VRQEGTPNSKMMSPSLSPFCCGSTCSVALSPDEHIISCSFQLTILVLPLAFVFAASEGFGNPGCEPLYYKVRLSART